MILSVMKNEFIKMKKQKTMYVITTIMLVLVVIRVLSLLSETNITLNGQTLPIIVVIMDITQYIPLFMVILIADVFTEDYRAGTLKLSLIRPVTRFELLLGKFLSLAVLTFIINMIIIISAYIVGTISGGWGSGLIIPATLMEEAGYTLQSDIIFSAINGILATLSSVVLETIVQLGFAAVIILLALYLNSLTGVIGIGIFLYAIFLVAMQILAKFTPFFLISSSYDICLLPLGVMDIGSILIKAATAIIYISVFLMASLIFFKKKDLLA